MATWADIQSWELSYVEEAEDLIEAEVREAREIIADLEHAAKDIRSQGEAPDRMRQRLSKIQDKLDSRLNELTEYALATAELHGYVSRVAAKRKSAWEVAAEVGYDIPESGVVQPSAPETRFEPVASKFAELRDCVDDAVRIATEAEETVGPRYQVLADGQYVLARGATRRPRAWPTTPTLRGAPRKSPCGGHSCRRPSARRSSTGILKSTAISTVSTWRRELRQMSLR